MVENRIFSSRFFAPPCHRYGETALRHYDKKGVAAPARTAKSFF